MSYSRTIRRMFSSGQLGAPPTAISAVCKCTDVTTRGCFCIDHVLYMLVAPDRSSLETGVKAASLDDFGPRTQLTSKEWELCDASCSEILEQQLTPLGLLLQGVFGEYRQSNSGAIKAALKSIAILQDLQLDPERDVITRSSLQQYKYNDVNVAANLEMLTKGPKTELEGEKSVHEYDAQQKRKQRASREAEKVEAAAKRQKDETHRVLRPASTESSHDHTSDKPNRPKIDKTTRKKQPHPTPERAEPPISASSVAALSVDDLTNIAEMVGHQEATEKWMGVLLPLVNSGIQLPEAAATAVKNALHPNTADSVKLMLQRIGSQK